MLPQFNIDEWHAFADTPRHIARELSISPSVVGPVDAARAVIARRLLSTSITLGANRPTDIFILSVGEPPLRFCTKIGGLPSLEREIKWPTDSHGEPLPFLAQFNFSDSMDLTGQLPGKMLFIFGDLDARRGLSLVWSPLACSDSAEFCPELPDAPVFPSLWGSRWRTFNYPDVIAPNLGDFDNFTACDGTTVRNGFFAISLLGLQIGPNTTILPGQNFLNRGEEVICMVTMVIPRLGYPFPFLNRESPLTDTERVSCAFLLGDQNDCDMFGLLYVIRTRSGQFRWDLRNL